jgi:hypothetical protein
VLALSRIEAKARLPGCSRYAVGLGLLVEPEWLQDSEFLDSIRRDSLAVVLERLAPVLARQGVALPDAGLPEVLYSPKLAAVLRPIH